MLCPKNWNSSCFRPWYLWSTRVFLEAITEGQMQDKQANNTISKKKKKKEEEVIKQHHIYRKAYLYRAGHWI